jgi:hypothetical protein
MSSPERRIERAEKRLGPKLHPYQPPDDFDPGPLPTPGHPCWEGWQLFCRDMGWPEEDVPEKDNGPAGTA